MRPLSAAESAIVKAVRALRAGEVAAYGEVARRAGLPGRARLVARAQDWRWSSVRAHLHGREDGLTIRSPVIARFSPFRDFLGQSPDPGALARLRAAESVGRPLGNDKFLARLERLAGRALRPGKRGPKPRSHDEAQGRLI